MITVWFAAAVSVVGLALFMWRTVLRVAREAEHSLASVDRAELALGGMGIQVGRAKRHLARMSRTRFRRIIFRRMTALSTRVSSHRSDDLASET
ncbi:MAG TPA: hypothetical protein QF409_10620 [Acidimicrobiales bacterium]|nr:hypothetical protein [Acidimicrobiales bacterium]